MFSVIHKHLLFLRLLTGLRYLQISYCFFSCWLVISSFKTCRDLFAYNLFIIRAQSLLSLNCTKSLAYANHFSGLSWGRTVQPLIKKTVTGLHYLRFQSSRHRRHCLSPVENHRHCTRINLWFTFTRPVKAEFFAFSWVFLAFFSAIGYSVTSKMLPLVICSIVLVSLLHLATKAVTVTKDLLHDH